MAQPPRDRFTAVPFESGPLFVEYKHGHSTEKRRNLRLMKSEPFRFITGRLEKHLAQSSGNDVVAAQQYLSERKVAVRFIVIYDSFEV